MRTGEVPPQRRIPLPELSDFRNSTENAYHEEPHVSWIPRKAVPNLGAFTKAELRNGAAKTCRFRAVWDIAAKYYEAGR